MAMQVLVEFPHAISASHFPDKLTRDVEAESEHLREIHVVSEFVETSHAAWDLFDKQALDAYLNVAYLRPA